MSFDAAVVAAHAAAIRTGRWFTLVGLPFSDDERTALEPLAPRIVRVGSWHDARRTADDRRANVAYDIDATEVVALKAKALGTVGPDVLMEVMSAVVDRGLEVFMQAADRVARRAGIFDEELARVAAGAATEAVYRGALASAIDGPTHRFARIEALFASGRWPLARIDDTLYVF
jgi:hypothetical protein